MIKGTKGISGREAGYRLTNRTEDSQNENDNNRGIITMENVHQCTTYDLRQELKKRGYFLETVDTEKAPTINYRTLLEAY